MGQKHVWPVRTPAGTPVRVVLAKPRRAAALGLAVALSVVACGSAAACGGSSRAALATVPAGAAAARVARTADTQSAAGVSSAHAQAPARPPTPGFAARAAAICRSSNRQIAVALLGGLGGKQGGSGWTIADHEFLASEQLLRGLTPPQRVAGAWRALLAKRASLATALAQPADLSTAAGQTRAATRRRLRAQVRASAAGAGVKDCGTIG